MRISTLSLTSSQIYVCSVNYDLRVGAICQKPNQFACIKHCNKNNDCTWALKITTVAAAVFHPIYDGYNHLMNDDDLEHPCFFNAVSAHKSSGVNSTIKNDRKTLFISFLVLLFTVIIITIEIIFYGRLDGVCT